MVMGWDLDRVASAGHLAGSRRRHALTPLRTKLRRRCREGGAQRPQTTQYKEPYESVSPRGGTVVAGGRGGAAGAGERGGEGGGENRDGGREEGGGGIRRGGRWGQGRELWSRPRVRTQRRRQVSLAWCFDMVILQRVIGKGVYAIVFCSRPLVVPGQACGGAWQVYSCRSLPP